MADFTRYSYDEQLERMTEILKNAPGWGEGFDSTMGQTLIQLVTDVTDNLHFMLERRTIESYITTAGLRSSVIARASELGYRAKRARSTSGTLMVTLGNNATAAADITIPALTSLTSATGKQYVLAEDLVIHSGSTSGTARAKSGTPRSIQIPNSDETFQTSGFVLIRDFEMIDNDSLFVSSNDVEYLDVKKNLDGSPARRALSFLSENDAFYDIRYDVNGMRVIFGDNRFGKKPDGLININYIEVPEEDEELLQLNVEFSLGVSELFDADGNSYDFEIVSQSRFRGGNSPESISQIKENAVTYHKTNGRAVTTDDYNFWVLESGIGNIVDVQTSGEHELDSIVHNISNVYVNYVSMDGDNLDVDDINRLRIYFKPLQVVGSNLIIRPAQSLSVKINIMAARDKDLPISDSEFYNIIHRFITDYFQMRKGSIGRKVQKSDIINDIYKLRTTRNGIEYKVIDYVRIDMEAVNSIDNNSLSNATITISDNYTPVDGDELIVGISVGTEDPHYVVVEVEETDNRYDILLKLRDKILEVSDLRTFINLSGIAVDEFNYPLPYNLINPNPLQSFITVNSLGSDIEINRRYFSPRGVKLDVIPVYDGTTINFEAPSDSDVIVLKRDKIRAEDEDEITTVSAGQSYTLTTDGTIEAVRLQLVSNSNQELNVVTTYNNNIGVDINLVIETVDGFGEFFVSSDHGDLQNYVTISSKSVVTRRTRSIGQGTINIMEGSLRITDIFGETLYTTNKYGEFFDVAGVPVTGWVNHRTGEVELPSGIVNDAHYFIFSQDKWQNIGADQFSRLSLIAPNSSLNNQNPNISTIEVS